MLKKCRGNFVESIKQKHFISAAQLFSTLFIGRLIIILTTNAQLAGGGNFIDNVFSSLLAMALNFILIIPIYLLHRRRPTLNIIDDSYFLFGKFGMIISLFYGIYFIAVNWYYLSFFQLFIENVIDPQTPVWLISVAVLVVACYGAYKGVEAIVRVSGFILIAISAGLIFIITTLSFQIDPINYEPAFYEGNRQMIMGMVLYLARSTGFAMIALLLPITKGKKKLGFSIWNISVYLAMAIILLVMVGAVGDYLKTQLFPVYAATSMAEAGPFQRLDAVYLGMWMMGLFIKIALDLFLVSLCITKSFGNTAGKISIIVGAILIAIISQMTTFFQSLQSFFYGPWFLGFYTFLVAFFIPFILLITDRIKNGSKKEI